MDAPARPPRPPFVTATIVSACAAYQGWAGITTKFWPTGVVATVLAVAAVGLWTNRRWAQWPVYAIAVLTVGEWIVLANRPILSPTNPYVLVASYVPGILLIAACAAACGAVALHFQRKPA